MAVSTFDSWLGEKLKSLSLDEEVYLDYLKGILEECNEDEQKDTIADILGGIIGENAAEFSEEIVCTYQRLLVPTITAPSSAKAKEDTIKSLIVQKSNAEYEKKAVRTNKVDAVLKSKMLEQYAEISTEESESEDDDVSCKKSSKSSGGEFVNTNAQDVVAVQNQQREKLRLANEEKKKNDKLNREKEKSKKQERSEKEKKRTQKGERRRDSITKEAQKASLRFEI